MRSYYVRLSFRKACLFSVFSYLINGLWNDKYRGKTAHSGLTLTYRGMRLAKESNDQPVYARIFVSNIKAMLGIIIASAIILTGFATILYETYTELKAEKNKQ